MYLKLFLITFLFTTESFGNEQSIKKLMSDYLLAINHKNEALIKKVTKPKLLNRLIKNKSLAVMFDSQKVKKHKVEFDMEIKKSPLVKNQFKLRIKDKQEKHYQDFWYIVEFTDNQYKIANIVFVDN